MSRQNQVMTELTGGYRMEAKGSVDSNWSGLSYSSRSTCNSCPVPNTPMSDESKPSYQLDDYKIYNAPIAYNSDHLSRDQYFTQAPFQTRAVKATPLTLGWTPASELLKLYKFVVKQNGKERYFELLPPWRITRQTPQRVDLDQDQHPVKGKHRCMYPGGCKGKQNIFGRPADLDRHYQNVHGDDDQKKKFFCDYHKCGRANDPFTRKDHYQSHLKDFHQEDIGSAKGRHSKTKPREVWLLEQEQWLRDRKIYSHYWRCSRCLDRITVASQGWECQRCKTPCEPERIEARAMLAPKTEVFEYAMNLDTEDEYKPGLLSYSGCGVCMNGYIDNGTSSWVECPECVGLSQSLYLNDSYNNTRW